MNNYILKSVPSFERELENTYQYIAYILKEPMIANKFYHHVIKKVFSFQYSPGRYSKISNYHDRETNLRRLPVDNYVIIYKVNNHTGQVLLLHIFHR